MATSIPTPSQYHQTTLTDLAPSSPPRPSFFTLGSHEPPNPSSNDKVNPRTGFQVPFDFHSNPSVMATNGSSHGGPVQMPRGPTSNLPPSAPRHRSTASMSAFDVSRSPPNPKSTQHVPCRFYRLGQCQAGHSCPFSHNLDVTGDEICKYYQKVPCNPYLRSS